MRSYKDRDTTLRTMGFINYAEYLQSDLWYIIRRNIYNRDHYRCRGKSSKGKICRRKVSCAHHWDYTLETLIGVRPHMIITVCEPCHRQCEFYKRKKRTLDSVYQATWKRLYKHERVVTKYKYMKDLEERSRPTAARIAMSIRKNLPDVYIRYRHNYRTVLEEN